MMTQVSRSDAPEKALKRYLLGMLVTALLATGAVAHRGHGMWSEVSWAGNGFEIIHRIHLSDALRVLEEINNTATIESMEGLALLALYVESNFTVHFAGSEVALTTLGAEIDDDFLYVFQEWLTPLPNQVPEFTSHVLLDIEPSAQAYVHYEAPGINKTLQLDNTGRLDHQHSQFNTQQSALIAL